jgi:DNA-binding transcriptional regulator YdaS (Cro superfamily)
MNAREWVDAFAARLGVEPPTAAEWSELLDVAGAAAHASERVAAPVSCWVLGRAGIAPAEALAIARELAPPDG